MLNHAHIDAPGLPKNFEILIHEWEGCGVVFELAYYPPDSSTGGYKVIVEIEQDQIRTVPEILTAIGIFASSVAKHISK